MVLLGAPLTVYRRMVQSQRPGCSYRCKAAHGQNSHLVSRSNRTRRQARFPDKEETSRMLRRQPAGVGRNTARLGHRAPMLFSFSNQLPQDRCTLLVSHYSSPNRLPLSKHRGTFSARVPSERGFSRGARGSSQSLCWMAELVGANVGRL